MRTIWKYQIDYFRETVGTFQMPGGARFVHASAEFINPGSLQHNAVSLWFEVDPEAWKEFRVFELFGTGHDIPDGAGEYRATVVAPPLVLHVYEREGSGS